MLTEESNSHQVKLEELEEIKEARYSHVGIGMGVIILLIAVIGFMLAWRMGYLPQNIIAMLEPDTAVDQYGQSSTNKPLTEHQRVGKKQDNIVSNASRQEKEEKITSPSGMSDEPRAKSAGNEKATRYALEFGNFYTDEEANGFEEDLNKKGLSTVRYRHVSTGKIYRLSIEEIQNLQEANSVNEKLKQDNINGIINVTGDGRYRIILNGNFYRLKETVEFAENMKAKGYLVKIETKTLPLPVFNIRIVGFPSYEKALEKSNEFSEKGLLNSIVKIK